MTFVGRFGGDEFIVVAENIGDPMQAGSLGERLLGAIAQPLPGLGARVITASIGIALIRTSGIEAREAIRRSDAAMYEAKRTGGIGASLRKSAKPPGQVAGSNWHGHCTARKRAAKCVWYTSPSYHYPAADHRCRGAAALEQSHARGGAAG